MQVVYEAGNLIDAHLVRHALEHAGLPAFVRGEALLGGIGELPACGLLAVCVPDSAVAQARGILAALPLLAGRHVAGARHAAAAGDPDGSLAGGLLPA